MAPSTCHFKSALISALLLDGSGEEASSGAIKEEAAKQTNFGNHRSAQNVCGLMKSVGWDTLLHSFSLLQ